MSKISKRKGGKWCMKRKKVEETGGITIEFPPAMNRKEQEDQCACLAYNLVAKRLREGTATSQETTYFLKVGSTRERNERRILELQEELIQTKIDANRMIRDNEKLAEEAIKAMRRYQGSVDDEVNVL